MTQTGFSLHSVAKCCTQSAICLEIVCLLPRPPLFFVILGLLFGLRGFSEDSRAAAAQNIRLWHVACNTMFRLQAELTSLAKVCADGISQVTSPMDQNTLRGCDGSHSSLRVNQRQ